MVGIDRNKMRIFDVEESAQSGLSETPSYTPKSRNEKSTNDFVF
jgi:hypothetical protein